MIEDIKDEKLTNIVSNFFIEDATYYNSNESMVIHDLDLEIISSELKLTKHGFLIATISPLHWFIDYDTLTNEGVNIINKVNDRIELKFLKK